MTCEYMEKKVTWKAHVKAHVMSFYFTVVYTPDMDSHTEHTVTQTSIRQSLIHFTQVGQVLPAHPLFPDIDSRFTRDTQNHTKRNRASSGNVSRSVRHTALSPSKSVMAADVHASGRCRFSLSG